MGESTSSLTSEEQSFSKERSLSPALLKISIEIKNHVLQLEVLSFLTIFFLFLSMLREPLARVIGPDFSFLLPFFFLALIPILAPVTNPEYTLRSIVKGALSGMGSGATIGGGIAGVLSGGLGTPAGALIGGGIGLIVGAVGLPITESGKKVMTQGEAREFLHKKRRAHPDLSMEIIVDATKMPPVDPACAVYMFTSDGMIKCTKEDALKWLNSGCWKQKGQPRPNSKVYGEN